MKSIAQTRSIPQWRQIAVPVGRFLLTFLLSASQTADGYTPWALAMVCAAGPELSGLTCLAGAAAGALVFLPFQPGLRYLATIILIFCANTAFYDTRFYRKRWFRSILAAIAMLLVQSVYLLHRDAAQWAQCITAAALCAVASTAFGFLQEEKHDSAPFRRGLFLLTVALLMAAVPIMLAKCFSPGRALAAALALLIAGSQSPAQGAVCGMCIGFAVDLAMATPLSFTAVYGIASALAALLRERSPFLRALVFCSTTALLSLFIQDTGRIGLIGEAAFAGAIALTIPVRRWERRLAIEAPKPEPTFQILLERSAAAFRDLYDSFFRGTIPSPPENPSVIFDRAAEQVCRYCVLCSNCWQKNYTATYQAFNSACPGMLKRGQAQSQDFPLTFTSHCVHLTDFIAALNAEIGRFLLRRQYHQRLLSARQQAQEQYALLGDLLSSSAHQAVAASTGAPLGYRIGSSLRPKEGEKVCGDQLAVFEVGQTLYLLLSDGMGSGESAHREAAMTVRLLRQFLEAGIDALPALKTLNTALSLRSDDGGGFTTIDLLALQRGSGTATLYKYGAAPSYCKRTGCVSRINAQSLPAGLQGGEAPPERTQLSLQAGNYLVMVSDGIADASSDEWLQNLLAGWNGSDPNALVSLIMREARQRRGMDDDCAVLVLYLPDDGQKKQV
ncbi:MAG: SpoIIE family protein phosphatase [Eubacteriales bacterium]|nr:SpoIIE family protein phosphatase [Eubacteriales bacterium]